MTLPVCKSPCSSACADSMKVRLSEVAAALAAPSQRSAAASSSSCGEVWLFTGEL